VALLPPLIAEAADVETLLDRTVRAAARLQLGAGAAA
jgi:hypothetical protein